MENPDSQLSAGDIVWSSEKQPDCLIERPEPTYLGGFDERVAELVVQINLVHQTEQQRQVRAVRHVEIIGELRRSPLRHLGKDTNKH